jgi:hypothetical protein
VRANPENEKRAAFLPDVSLELSNFDNFMVERKKLMIAKLREVLLK